MIAQDKTSPHSSAVLAEKLIDKGSLIDHFLNEQKKLTTAVTRFADWHDQHGNTLSAQKNYQHLIPLSRPAQGEQYAFQVDLDTCSGCKACVAACHSMNGLDQEEAWRDVGLLHMRDQKHSLQQTVTTACHHCADPACSNGCPVLAYEKDELTGIVRHLDDQCIGCQYCVLKCPYDVPKYHEVLGIVRKCDMCHSRLSVNEAPACVQSCPNEAIRIIKITLPEIHAASSQPLVAGAFASSYTLPTTRYLSTNPHRSSLQPANATSLRVEPTHLPLVLMLVLTQASAGAALANALHFFLTEKSNLGLALTATFLTLLGLIASVTHLGRPWQAWRAFLGWKKSWLSREILVFGNWFPLLVASLLLTLLNTPFLSDDLLLNVTNMAKKEFNWILDPAHLRLTQFQLPLLSLAVLVGLLSVYCSIMVYVDTRRPYWSMSLASGKFIGTLCILGAALAAGFTGQILWAWGAVFFTTLKVCSEIFFLKKHLSSDPQNPQTKTARVLWEVLQPWTLARFASSILGLALLWLEPWSGILFLVAGELIERSLFFRAVNAPRMPGNLA